jgi:histidine triad (HIT) family protein
MSEQPPQLTEEQQQELQEKLKNMSPEELQEFQKQQCIFCQIISGKIPSKKIYEDEFCFAILDINPAVKGHLLLIPKEHYAIMPQVPEKVIGHMFVVARALSQLLLKALKVGGTNIFIANGLVAGQRAQHFIIHVIPRKEGDKILDIEEKIIDSSLQEKVKVAIENKLNELLGVKKEVVNVTENEPVEESEEETYITSAQAKRFHVATCPFAAKIQKEKRIHLSKEEALEKGYKPCKCTGLLGEHPEKVGRAAIEEKSEVAWNDEEVDQKKVKKKVEEDATGETDSGSSLDDIANLFK